MPPFLTNQARVLPRASQAAGDGIDNATALVIRVENGLFQLAHVADPTRLKREGFNQNSLRTFSFRSDPVSRTPAVFVLTAIEEYSVRTRLHILTDDSKCPVENCR